MEIDKVLEDLKYNPRLNFLISQVCEFSLTYYSNLNKDFIIKLLNDVKIYSVSKNESMSEMMNNLSTVKQTGDDLTKEFVDSARGAFYSEPIISEGESGYILEGSNKFVLINEAQIETTEDMLAVVAHEYSHALKSQLEEYKIFGNTIFRRSGLSIETGQILKDNEGKIFVNWNKLQNLGIEEAMATHFECQAVQSIFNNNNYYKKIHLYLPLLKVANSLQLKSPKLFSEINSNQIFPEALRDSNLQDIFKNVDLLLESINGKNYLDVTNFEQISIQLIESLAESELKI